ncbi:MAG TPA: glycosyltransferase family 87 protein [Stellaceae bacterium]|nr:glycosyltransferase family 87 protein [Stellaceae bacterium]
MSDPAARRSRRRQKALGIGLGFLAGCYVIAVVFLATLPTPVHLDFFGMWGWSRFLAQELPARMYDYAALQAYLWSLHPGYPPMPFAYPPTYMLLIRPLASMSYPVAQTMWSGLTLMAYVAAFRGGSRPLTFVLALLAPATAVNLLYGQNGFLTAALLVGGMRAAPSRPILGGILLGLLSYKAQFGLLVAVALVAAEAWLAVLVAAVTVLALVAASLLAFGADPWITWFHTLPQFGAILYEERARLYHMMPTALSNAMALGAGDRVAYAVQGAVVLAAAVGVWFAFRRDRGRLAVAALAVGSVLASPYAFLYDLTLVGAAIALLSTDPRVKLSVPEIAALVAALLLPAGMLFNVVPPIATVVNGAVFGIILFHIRRNGAEQRVSTDQPASARSSASTATATCSAANGSGGRILSTFAWGPSVPISTPCSRIRFLMRLASSGAGARLLPTISTPIISPQPRTSPIWS